MLKFLALFAAGYLLVRMARALGFGAGVAAGKTAAPGAKPVDKSRAVDADFEDIESASGH